MSQHHAAIQWQRTPCPLDRKTYSRNHVAILNGQQSVNVSASVEYKGDPMCADPEQLLVSAVSSCHMLTFLAIAEFQGYRVEQYEDYAVGYPEPDSRRGAQELLRRQISESHCDGGEREGHGLTLAARECRRLCHGHG